ncbi:alpha-ketoglutarate-dependent dioxygenase AlkB [uncultured Planktosalinus sp.]|uniref:alpha-ketoglutarate-dependent dioxygenase AlkB family protein n=1 Tax=uncultured Planktosalinus sp. TaxID=1810935 RepID=UPI0030D78565
MKKVVFNLPDADISYFPKFYAEDKATKVFNQLLKETPWQQDKITVFGKTHLQPRLTALYADNEKTYSYSNITMHPKPFSPLLKELKTDIEKQCNDAFSTVLLNLYRHGKDSNGWHSDDEKELGKNPAIASLSFGEERWFHLKHKFRPELKTKIILQHGSLLVMKGTTQHFWKHQISKTSREVNPRINLTFRLIK